MQTSEKTLGQIISGLAHDMPDATAVEYTTRNYKRTGKFIGVFLRAGNAGHVFFGSDTFRDHLYALYKVFAALLAELLFLELSKRPDPGV